ncbi:MAG: O-antigen ligase family protein [Betaproteobacteria bacterium]
MRARDAMPNNPLKFEFSGNRRDLPRRLPWAACVVAVFVFLAPNLDFAHALPWHDGQRLAQLGMLLVVTLTLAVPGNAASVATIWANLPRTIRYALLMAFALGVASGFTAAFPRWALLEIGLLLLLVVLGLSIAANRRVLGDRADPLLVLLFFATAAAYAFTTCSVYVAMLLVGPAYGQGFDIRELYTSFSNVRFFGHVQTMLLPFLLLPVMWWGTTRLRGMLLWSVPAIWWMLAVGSGTRGTWAALLVGVIAALLFCGNAGRRWAKWQGAGLLCGLLCYGVFVLGIPQLLDLPASFLHRTEDIVSLSLREVLWTTAWDYILQNPWLGVGPMHYAYWATEVAAHPHNAVLQWLAEWGVPAGLLLTGVWATGGISLLVHVRREAEQGDDQSQLFRVALLAALAGASAQAMVDGVLVMPVSQTLLALLAGWSMGMMPAGGGRVAGRGARLILMPVVLMAASAVAYGVAPEINRLAERQQSYLAARGPNTILLPRFWTLGWIHINHQQ